MRSDRKGEVVDATLYYDGDNLAIYGKRADLYAQTKAPPTLDRAIDFARERLDMEAPAADLLYSNPYEGLMEDVVAGRYLGTAEIRGKTCHHLAYKGNQTDWQIWIDAGAQPLPCKYLIVSKDMRAAPEFSVEFRDWEENPRLAADTFVFEPPRDAQEISFFLPPAQPSTETKAKK
jgi:hypothetical protein